MPDLSLVTIMFLVFIVTQRLGELFHSRSNTKILRAKETLECGQSFYPYLLSLQLMWLLGLLLAGHIAEVNLNWLGCFFVLQVFHFWIIIQLGERWTIRLFIFDEPTVKTGLLKYSRHPNHMLRVAETFVAPMVLGLWQLAIIFTALYALLLVLRANEGKKVLALSS